MSILKVAIIDDQEDSVEKICFLLKKYFHDVELVGFAYSGKDGISLINEQKPDLLFLDVEMEDMTGFEMLERIDKIDFKVIFITASDQYAIRAIRSSASDYLVKPVGKEELINAINRTKELSIKSKLQSDSDKINVNINKNQMDRLAFSTSEGLIFKDVKDIIYCESERNYTNVFLINKEKLLVSKTLKELDEILDNNGFFRIHNSYLINLAYVEKYVRTDGGYVVMKNNSTIKVSRDRKDGFLDKFSKF